MREYMTYEEWEELHERRAMIEARKRQNEWARKHEADRERRHYFCNQRFIGVLLIAVSLIVCFIFADISALIVASTIALLGIVMITTKKMVIVNDYWHKHGGADQWKE